MLVEVKMPNLGESIKEATILSFNKSEGQWVEEGETIIEVATDKVDSEITSPSHGQIEKILVNVDDVVAIGEVLMIIDTANVDIDKTMPEAATQNAAPIAVETKGKDTAPSHQGGSSTQQSSPAPAISESHPAISSQTEIFLSPLVLSIAKEENLSMEDVKSIRGTGANGRIRKSDIVKYIKSKKYPLPKGTLVGPHASTQPSHQSDFRPVPVSIDPSKDRILQMDRMGAMIADHMVYSKRTSPHVTCYVEVDLTKVVNWRNEIKSQFAETNGYKMTFTPIFVEAVAKAIHDFPMINVSLRQKEIILKKDINIGMATALPSGNLIVPVVKNADKKDLKEIAQEVDSLVQKARENQLTPADISDGTFTLSNVGTFGSLTGTPIINQPQSAILATGIIKKRPVVVEDNGEDKIEIRQIMIMALSFDHRVINGHLGGSFAKRVADHLESFNIDRKL